MIKANRISHSSSHIPRGKRYRDVHTYIYKEREREREREKVNEKANRKSMRIARGGTDETVFIEESAIPLKSYIRQIGRSRRVDENAVRTR